MSEPTDERGAPSRARLAACRPAPALSDSVPDILVVLKENRAPIPETVGPGRAQLAADLLQGRQHDVDRQRDQGHDQRRKRNEFAEAELRAGARQGTNTDDR